MVETAKEKQKLSGKQWGILISIVLMFFFAPTFAAVSSTFSLMPDYFGVTPALVGYISVMANPASCIAGLVVGAFAGTKLSYKSTAIVAMLFFTVFGGLPFLWQGISFPMLLVSRFLFGLGCGCINPLVQAVITHMFTSETARAGWIGIINIMFSVGASTGSLITGFLAEISWQTSYAFYLFAIIPLILVILFFKDSEIAGKDPHEAAAEKAEAPKEKRRVPGIAWLYIVIFMFCTLIAQVFFSYAGIAMGESGVNPALIGTVFTVFTVTGIAVAALNSLLWRFLRLWNLPLSYATLALAYVFCIIGFNTGSVAWFFLASVVMGIGTCLCGMCLPMIMSVTVPAAALTLAIGFQEVARNLGSFLSSPWLQAIGGIFGDTPIPQFTAIAALGVIVTLVAAIVAAKDSKRFKDVEIMK